MLSPTIFNLRLVPLPFWETSRHCFHFLAKPSAHILYPLLIPSLTSPAASSLNSNCKVCGSCFRPRLWFFSCPNSRQVILISPPFGSSQFNDHRQLTTFLPWLLFCLAPGCASQPRHCKEFSCSFQLWKVDGRITDFTDVIPLNYKN